MNPGNPVTSIRTAARECKGVRSAALGSGARGAVPIRDDVKRLAIITAAAALALTPAAAAAPNPGKHERPAKAKSERTTKKAKPDSARARCAAERTALGAVQFTAKYGKPRTKGSAKAKAKAARAAFGRCVAKTAKVIRAEREAAEDAEDAASDAGDLAEDLADGEVFVDDEPDEPEKPEPDDGDVVVDHDGDEKGADDPDPDAGLVDGPDLD
jgi:hypothetical protein